VHEKNTQWEILSFRYLLLVNYVRDFGLCFLMRINRTLLNNPVPREAVIYQIIRGEDRTFELERIRQQALRHTVYLMCG